MQWEDLLGHNQQKEWFRTALTAGRLATSFLFIGPDGIGKRMFAKLLTKSLLCRESQPSALSPCGHCADCAQVDAGTHPDSVSVAKPVDKAFIPIELLIGEREKRMRAGLCHEISMRPYGGRRKIAVIDDADHFNTEGANCLLKTLEEPPADSLLILLGTSLQRQLPTIRSRCQAIIFRPLTDEQLATLIVRYGLADSLESAQQLSGRCGGSMVEAQLMANPEVMEFRAHLLETLAQPQLPIMALAKSCLALIDAAGKDARVKRERSKLIFRLAAAFYREMSLPAGTAASELVQARKASRDPVLAQAVGAAGGGWKTGSRAATQAWQRCLLAMEQVDRNANQATLIECWAADMASLSGC